MSVGNPHYVPDYENYYQPELNDWFANPIHPRRAQQIENFSRFMAQRTGPVLPLIAGGVPLGLLVYTGYKTAEDYLVKQNKKQADQVSRDRELRIKHIRAKSTANIQRNILRRLDALGRHQPSIGPPIPVQRIEQQPDQGPAINEVDISDQVPRPAEPPPRSDINIPKFKVNAAERIYKFPGSSESKQLSISANKLINALTGGITINEVLTNPEYANEPALKFFTQEGFQNAINDPTQYIPEVAFKLVGQDFRSYYTNHMTTVTKPAKKYVSDKTVEYMKRNMNYATTPTVTDVPDEPIIPFATIASNVMNIRRTNPGISIHLANQLSPIVSKIKAKEPHVNFQDAIKRAEIELREKK